MENQNIGNKAGSRSIGPVIGLIVIIAVILLGGIYFWSTRSGDQENNYSNPATTGAEQNKGNENLNNGTSATVNTSVPSSYNSTEVENALNESDPEQIDTEQM